MLTVDDCAPRGDRGIGKGCFSDGLAIDSQGKSRSQADARYCLLPAPPQQRLNRRARTAAAAPTAVTEGRWRLPGPVRLGGLGLPDPPPLPPPAHGGGTLPSITNKVRKGWGAALYLNILN